MCIQQALNETVEKPYLQVERKTAGGAIDRLFALNAAQQDGAGLDRHPKDMDLADIVNQSEPRPRPLYIHFAFGALYRRLGPPQAAVATAYLIARVVYRMLRYKVEYEPLSVAEYERHYQEQQPCAEPVEASNI